MPRAVDVHSLESLPAELVALERRFDALFARLSAARVELAADRLPDLAPAAELLDGLCREFAALPPEQAAILEPRLLALVHEVRELFEAAARRLRETGEELGRLAARGAALRAYGRAGGKR